MLAVDLSFFFQMVNLSVRFIYNLFTLSLYIYVRLVIGIGSKTIFFHVHTPFRVIFIFDNPFVCIHRSVRTKRRCVVRQKAGRSACCRDRISPQLTLILARWPPAAGVLGNPPGNSAGIFVANASIVCNALARAGKELQGATGKKRTNL